MARIKDTVIPLGNYPTGAHEFGPATVSNQAYALGFEFARCTTATPDIWPDASTELQYGLSVSFDNGVTWQYAGGGTAVGGIHVKRDGTEAGESFVMMALPPGNNRRVRITATISNGPLRTEGRLFVET